MTTIKFKIFFSCLLCLILTGASVYATLLNPISQMASLLSTFMAFVLFAKWTEHLKILNELSKINEKEKNKND